MVTEMIAAKTVNVSQRYWSLTALCAIAGSEISGRSTAMPPSRILFFRFISLGSNLVGIADQFLGHFVEILGLHRVVAGDAPGDDELGKCKEDAEVDDTEDLDLEQVGEIGGADRQQEIIDDRQDHQPREKRHLLGVKRLKAWIVVDRRPV